MHSKSEATKPIKDAHFSVLNYWRKTRQFLRMPFAIEGVASGFGILIGIFGAFSGRVSMPASVLNQRVIHRVNRVNRVKRVNCVPVKISHPPPPRKIRSIPPVYLVFERSRQGLTRLAQRVKCRVVCLACHATRLVRLIITASKSAPAAIATIAAVAVTASVTSPVFAQTNPEITISVDKTAVKEGEGFVLRASTPASLNSAQTITFTFNVPSGYSLIHQTSSGQAVSYSGTFHPTHTFPANHPGNTNVTLATYSVAEDNLDTPDGVIVITALPLGGSFTIVPPAQFEVAVSDNDVLSIAPASVTMDEGENQTFTLALSEAQSETVEVFWTTGDDSARRGLDYVAGNATLIFAPGETTKTISVESVDNFNYSPLSRHFFVEANGTIAGKVERVRSRVTLIEKESVPELTIKTNNIVRAGRGQNVTFIVEIANGVALGTDLPVRLFFDDSVGNISASVQATAPPYHIVKIPKGETSVSFSAQATSNLSKKYMTIRLIDFGDPYTLQSSSQVAAVQLIEPEIAISVNATQVTGGERVEFTLAVSNGYVSSQDIPVQMAFSVGFETFDNIDYRSLSPDLIQVTLPAYANNVSFTAVMLGDFNSPQSTLTLQDPSPDFPDHTLSRNLAKRVATVRVNVPEISIAANATNVVSGEEVTFTLTSSDSGRIHRSYPIRLTFTDGVDVSSFSSNVNTTYAALQSVVEVNMPPRADSVNFTARLFVNSDGTMPRMRLHSHDSGSYRVDASKQVAQVVVSEPLLLLALLHPEGQGVDPGGTVSIRVDSHVRETHPSGTPTIRVRLDGDVVSYSYEGVVRQLSGTSNIIDLPWPLNNYRIAFDVTLADNLHLTSPTFTATLLDGQGYNLAPMRDTVFRSVNQQPILSMLPLGTFPGTGQARFGIRIDNGISGPSRLPVNIEVAGAATSIFSTGGTSQATPISPPQVVTLDINTSPGGATGRILQVATPRNPNAPAILRLLPGEGYSVNPDASVATSNISQPTLNITYLTAASYDGAFGFFINGTETEGHRNVTVSIEVSGDASAFTHTNGDSQAIPQPTPSIINVTIDTIRQPIRSGDRTLIIVPSSPLDDPPSLRLLPGVGYHVDPDAAVATAIIGEPRIGIIANATQAHGGDAVTFILTNANSNASFDGPRNVRLRLDGDAKSYRIAGGGTIAFENNVIEVPFVAEQTTANLTIQLDDFPTRGNLTATLVDGSGYAITAPTTASVPIIKPTLTLNATATAIAFGAEVDYVIGIDEGGDASRVTNAVVAVTGDGVYTHVASGKTWRVINGPPAFIPLAINLNNRREVLRVTTNSITNSPITAQLHPSRVSAYSVHPTANKASVSVKNIVLSIRGEEIDNGTKVMFVVESSVQLPSAFRVPVDVNGVGFNYTMEAGQSNLTIIFPFVPGVDHLTATLGEGAGYTLHPINYFARVDTSLPTYTISVDKSFAEFSERVVFTIESDIAPKYRTTVKALFNRTIFQSGREVVPHEFIVEPGQTRATYAYNLPMESNDEGPTIMTLQLGTGYYLDPEIAKQRAVVAVKRLVVELSADRASIAGGDNVTFTIKTQDSETSITNRFVFISFSGAIEGTSFSNRLPLGCRVLCTFPVILPAGRPSVSFTARAAPVIAPSSMTLTLQGDRRGYELSSSPARRRAQVRVTQNYEPVLDIVADTQGVFGGDNITFTINTPLAHDSSRDPVIEIPPANTPISIRVDGDLTGYTYNNTLFNFASTSGSPATPATIRLPWAGNATSINFTAHVDATPDPSERITAQILDSAGYDPHPNPANHTASVRVGVDGTPAPRIGITANASAVFKNSRVGFRLAIINNITTIRDIPITLSHSAGVSGFSRHVTATPPNTIQVTLPAGNDSIAFDATIAGLADGSPSSIMILDGDGYNLPDLNGSLRQASVAIVKPQFVITNFTSSIREAHDATISTFRLESLHGPIPDPLAVNIALASPNLIEYRHEGNAQGGRGAVTQIPIGVSPYNATLRLPQGTRRVEFGVKVGTSPDNSSLTATILEGAGYELSTNATHNIASVPILQPEFSLALAPDTPANVEGGDSVRFVISTPHSPLIDNRSVHVTLDGDVRAYTFDGITRSLATTPKNISLPFGFGDTSGELLVQLRDNPSLLPISAELRDGVYYDLSATAPTTASVPVVEPIFSLGVDDDVGALEAGESVNITVLNHNRLHLGRNVSVKLVANGNAESWLHAETNKGNLVTAGREILQPIHFLPEDNPLNNVFVFVVAENATGPVVVELRDTLGYRLATGPLANTTVTIPVRLPRLAITANATEVDEGGEITYTIMADNAIAPGVNRTLEVELSEGLASYRLAGGDPVPLVAGAAPHRLQVVLPAHATSVNFTAKVVGLSYVDVVNATLLTPPSESGYELVADVARQTAQVRVNVPPLPVLGMFIAQETVTNDQDGVAVVEYDESVTMGEIIIRTINGSKLPRNISVEWRVSWGENRASVLSLNTTAGPRAVGDTIRHAGSGVDFISYIVGNNAFTANATLIAGNEGIAIPLVIDVNDAVDENVGVEHLFYQLTVPAGVGYAISLPDQNASMRIYDDDPAIAVAGDPYVTEGATAEARFSVVGGGATSKAHTIKYRINDPDGVTMDDGSVKTLALPAGASTANVSIATSDDTVLQALPRKHFAIEVLDNVSDGYRLATPAATPSQGQSIWNITILDDDLTLALSPATANVGEGEAVNVTITIDQAQPLPFTLSYATLADTAQAGVDYEALNASVEFAANETSKTIQVKTVDNNNDVPENLRFMVVANASVNGADLTATSTITIADNDQHPELTIAADKNSVRRSENVTFTITSPFEVTADTDVQLVLDGSVEAYSVGGVSTTIQTPPDSIQVTLPMGQASIAIIATVSATPDYTKNITASLQAGAGYAVPADPASQVAQVEVLRPIPPEVGIYIVDDEGNEVSTISFEEGHDSFDSFALVIRTANSTPLADPNIIQWQITQPASRVISAIDQPRAYNDIGSTAGVGSTTATNITNQTITGVVSPRHSNVGIMLNVTVDDNDVDDMPMRELTWALLPATSITNNYTIATGAASVKVSLYDNDPLITLGHAGGGDVVFVNEGDAVDIPLRVEGGITTTSDHQLALQVSDPLDLITGAAGRVTVPLARGADEATVRFDTNENAVLNSGSRNFTLEMLNSRDDGYGLGTRTRQTIVVRDDDAMLSITPPMTRVAEGESLNLTLSINQPQPTPFNVTYATIATTAQAGVDYEAKNTSVEFLAGETTKTITIQTLNNTIDVLADATFSVVANMSLHGETQIGTALIEIADNDNNFGMTLTPANTTIQEGDAVGFTLTLTNPLASRFHVTYKTSDGTAVAATNYQNVPPTTLTFQPGETTKTFTITTVADMVDSHNASLQFRVTANATRNGNVFMDDAVVHISESGTRPTITMALNKATVDEGGSFILSADADRMSVLPLTLTLNITTPAGFSVVNGTASFAGGTSVIRQATFPALTTSHEFMQFMVEEDDINADNGTFSVRTLPFPPTTPFTLNTPNWLNITLADNDDDPILGITASTPTANPREVVTFTIDSGGMQSTGARHVTINVTGGATSINNGSHTFTHDHVAATPTSIQVALPAGGVSASFTAIAHDSENATPDIVASLVDGAGYTIDPDRKHASVMVRQKQAAVTYALGFDRPSYHIMEGEAARVTFTITPPPPAPNAVFVNYATIDGSGRGGVHYQRTEGRVRFMPGEANKTIEVPSIQNVVAADTARPSVSFNITANVIVEGLRLNGSRVITISDEDEMPMLFLSAPPSVRVGRNATIHIESNRTTPPQNLNVMVEINGTSVEAVYAPAKGILAVKQPSVTGEVLLPKEQLFTDFYVQAKNMGNMTDNLTPITIRLLNGTGYLLHPNPARQQAVIQVQQQSNLSIPNLNTAILPQVVATLLDETTSAIAARSHAYFGDDVDEDRRWQRLTIGGANVREFAENYARNQAQREANENPWDAPDASRLTELPNPRDLSFNLAFRGGEANGFALWGQGFSRTLSGKYNGEIEFEGDIPGSIIGVEARGMQRLLLGVGFSDLSAKFDYTRRDAIGTLTRGTHETDLAGYHPYIAWRLRGGGHVWAVFGITDGEVTIRQNGIADIYRGEVETQSATFGFNTLADSRRQADGSEVSLNFHGDLSYASIAETPTRATSDVFLEARAIDLSIARVRIGGRVSKHSVFDSGAFSGGIFRRSLDLTLRHDSGDILEGGAVEVGASASLELQRGLTIDLSVRTLLFHEESLDEVGLRGRIAWSAPHAGGRGLQLVLAPEWGNSESQSDALLDSGIGAYRYYTDGDGGGRDDGDEARYAFDIRYGIPVFRGGLLTPFITGDAADIEGATYGSLFSYGDFTAGFEAVAGDEGKAFSRYSRDF